MALRFSLCINIKKILIIKLIITGKPVQTQRPRSGKFHNIYVPGAAKNKKLQKEIDDEQVVKEVKKEDKEEKPEEKSLYDLIDMMYDEK